MHLNWSEFAVDVLYLISTLGTIFAISGSLSNIKYHRANSKKSTSNNDAFTAELIQILETTKPDENSSNQNLEGSEPPSKEFKHFLGYLAIQKRYYESNLAQTRAVFFIGIALLFIGITIITLGLSLGLSAKNVDTVTMLLTFSAGVLVDFIGTIFVAIHAKTLETAATYQKYISRVSNSLLAKDFLNDISDPTLQQQALADIAKSLCQADQ